MAEQTVSDLDIRTDIVEAQVGFVEGVARPGTWWTGTERVAIAAEVRRAREHETLAPWVAPSSIDGMIAADHPLPAAAVDAVWRITNHAGTLTSEWYDSIVADLAVVQYVELVGLVAAMNAVDRFAGAMGVATLPLPEPEAGDPTRVDVPVEVTTHWVPTVDGPGGNVLRALSAVPAAWDSTRSISESHYVPQVMITGDLSWNRGILSRPQIEYVAAMTSKVNECFY